MFYIDKWFKLNHNIKSVIIPITQPYISDIDESISDGDYFGFLLNRKKSLKGAKVAPAGLLWFQ